MTARLETEVYPRDPLDEPPARATLFLLLGGFLCADRLGRTTWEFACALPQLHDLGLSEAGLRALLAKGYVEHRIDAENAAVAGGKGKAPWSAGSRFVLTGAGAVEALRGRWGAYPGRAKGGGASAAGPRADGPEAPAWVAALRELRFRSQVVRRYRRVASNQEAVLSAFQELGWPKKIEDPLPQGDAVDPVERLRDTVKNLNRGVDRRLIRFRVAPDAQGVFWIPAEG